MTRGRQYPATLTGHELMLVALYRSIEPDQQRQLTGLIYRWSCETAAARRFRDEGAQLGVEHLDASVLTPFIQAAGEVTGVVKRAA